MSHVIVGTAGHIDHGKSALVQALTGTDPDRLQEEKARGITIDLGFAHYERRGVRFAFVDVPGHERFVRNMLAGATGVDAVLFVVAADESVMPQTREHLDICRLLRVSDGVVAITKCDLVDEETRALVRLEVRQLLAGTFLAEAPMVDVSVRTGEGLDPLREALQEVAARVPARQRGGLVRLPIDRVFTIKGFGTVLTGTLMAGEVTPDQPLTLLPAGLTVKVRGVQVHGASAPRALAGQRTAVNVQGIDRHQAARGDVLVAPGAVCVSKALDVVFELVADARPLPNGGRVRFHLGTGEVMARVSLADVVDRPPIGPGAETSGPHTVSVVPPGGRAYARLRLERPLAATRGDRFILRAYSPTVTIGGGEVVDPLPPRGPIRTDAGRRRFALLDPVSDTGAREASARRVLDWWLAEAGPQGVARASLTSRLGLTPREADRLRQDSVHEGRATYVGDHLVGQEAMMALEQAVMSAIQQHHRDQPLSDGLPREEARSRVSRRAPPQLFDILVDALRAQRQVVGTDRLALATRSVLMASEETDALRRLEDAMRAHGLSALTEAGLVAATGLPAPMVVRLVARLARQKRLTRIGDLVVPQEALDALRADLSAVRAAAGSELRVDVAWFKERYGLTRKFAIPLLEHLDRERVTRRVGDARVIV